jgi:hypothetical protein
MVLTWMLLHRCYIYVLSFGRDKLCILMKRRHRKIYDPFDGTLIELRV